MSRHIKDRKLTEDSIAFLNLSLERKMYYNKVPGLVCFTKEAQKINPDLKEGDTVETEIVPRDFGRIAAQTAKQVIIQKLREVEREIVYNEFNERKGEIVSGLIQKADHNIVVMDLGKLEGVMPLKE